MCWVYDEVATVYEVSTRTARKQHTCSECGRAIRAGVRYEYTFIVFDGQASYFKTCERCARLGKSDAFESSRPPTGELWRSLRELDWWVKRKVGRAYAYLLRRGWKVGAQA